MGTSSFLLKSKSEHELHQQHIAHRAARDGEQHLSLPQVQADRHGDGDELGQAVGKVQHVNIAQAVDDEHAEDRARQC